MHEMGARYTVKWRGGVFFVMCGFGVGVGFVIDGGVEKRVMGLKESRYMMGRVVVEGCGGKRR